MKEIMDETMMKRSMSRMAHEIIENNKGCENLVLLGIKTRGEFLANRLVQMIQEFEGVMIPCESIDIRFWRDDQKHDGEIPKLNIDVKDKVVVLVDDVLFSGRTIRAAMDGVMYYGRASEIHLAVLIDRGHRQLPIKADYVGKNVPTSESEDVKVFIKDIDNIDRVLIKNKKED